MGDGYFYTLSAVAQSFAAIVGLNAIFVVYKLQGIANLCRALLQQTRRWWVREQAGPAGAGLTYEQYKTQSERLTDDDLRNWLKEHTGPTNIVDQKKKIESELMKCDTLKKSIFYWFKRTLMTNGIVIALSLISLPWRNYLSCPLRIIIVGLVLVLSCIVLLITIHAVLVTTGLKGLNFLISFSDNEI